MVSIIFGDKQTQDDSVFCFKRVWIMLGVGNPPPPHTHTHTQPRITQSFDCGFMRGGEERHKASLQMLNQPHDLPLCLFPLADSQRKRAHICCGRVSQVNQRKILLFTNRWRGNPDKSVLPKRKICRP